MTGGTPSYSDDRRRVLEATDIVQLVGEHLSLKRKGREYVCLCPFHDDHKPSMCVAPHKQIYHCFSCGAGGNAIDFLINYHKMEFVEALRLLAERANITLSGRKRSEAGAAPGARPDEPEVGRAEVVEANAFALQFFRAILRHPEHGSEARAMVERRGVSPEMVEAFEIGAAPDRWDGLIQTAESRGFPLGTLRAAGLLRARETGSGHYDAFRGRLMFPIHDQMGRPIAFGGRKLRDEDEPKYVNSPESSVFVKSRTLFAIKQASRAIQDANEAIVVEGYIDAIACHQAGVRNVVATLGTALTAEHARILQRMCDRVVLLFDSDEAGLRAADRALEAFFAAPIDVRIATLPAEAGAKDPDELLKMEGGVEVFVDAVERAADALEFRFGRMRDRASASGAVARARMVEEDVQRLVELGLNRLAPVRRGLVVRRLSEIAGVSEEDVRRALAGASRRRGGGPGGEVGAKASRLGPAEQALGALLTEPGLWAGLSEEARDILLEGAYAAGPIGNAARAAMELMAQGETAELSLVMSKLDEGESRQAAAATSSRVSMETRMEDLGALVNECVSRLLMERDARTGARGEGLAGVQERIERLNRAQVASGRPKPVMPRPAARAPS